MKRLFVTAVLLGVLTSQRGPAQEPVPAKPPVARPDVSPFAPPQMGSPEWYSSTNQESPKEYIRRRAQEKAEARRARIEGMRWIGYSPLRPTVSSTPFFAHPPTWGPVPSSYEYNLGPYWYHPVNYYSPYVTPY
jgi:hypothetical protein